MSMTRIGTATFIALTATVLAGAPVAHSAPSGPASAVETVEDLRAKGYGVQVNGTRNGPLTNCTVESVRGPFTDSPGAMVYVDLSCPAEYMY